ncbi:hypothetical protein ACJJTC_009473 [Scirpophaga incertulas]
MSNSSWTRYVFECSIWRKKSLRDYRTFSPDLGVLRFEGLNRVPEDLRPEPSNATWPRVFMREDQALRAFSEPGVSRRRGTEGVSLRCDTEVESNCNYDGERHQPGVSLRCDTEVESNCNYDGERHQPGVSLRRDTESVVASADEVHSTALPCMHASFGGKAVSCRVFFWHVVPARFIRL